MVTLPSTGIQVFNAAKHHQVEVSLAVAQQKRPIAGQKSAVKKNGRIIRVWDIIRRMIIPNILGG